MRDIKKVALELRGGGEMQSVKGEETGIKMHYKRKEYNLNKRENIYFLPSRNFQLCKEN